MTNSVAALLAVLIVVLIGADWALNDADALTFLGRKLVELIEYMAFWR
ncbi:hypothetical protein [Jannaschia rubra]|uniref:Uncharacterized protein n=1 Tax=Jannaschia rubra TaxID=282197 RepID=A0A0M6XVD5_9RHOB|nr:hypothetical protein [Jannaschia rubra]CTQ34221.1 hypothetical protein JAN5088_03014 [Jannaschia rubra]SFG20257.1 hypothetical protein SAMN04488517_103123 [Jannaschia rubra]